MISSKKRAIGTFGPVFPVGGRPSASGSDTSIHMCRCNTPLVRSRQGALYCVGCQMDVRAAPAAAAPAADAFTERPPVSDVRPGGASEEQAVQATAQQSRQPAPAAAPAKRVHSPVADAALKLPRLEQAATALTAPLVPMRAPTTPEQPGVCDLPQTAFLPSPTSNGSFPAGRPAGPAVSPPSAELEAAQVVHSITQTLLSKMLQVGAPARLTRVHLNVM